MRHEFDILIKNISIKWLWFEYENDYKVQNNQINDTKRGIYYDFH